MGNKEDYFKGYYINQYIIVDLKDTGKTIEYRFDGKDLVPLSLPRRSKVVKGKNSLQRCVLDMLNNKDIEICAVMGISW